MNLAIDLIIVPQGAEYRAVCRGLQRAKGQKPRVVSIAIGVNNPLPPITAKRVLIMGLCGSLSPQHAIGDGVLYKSCENLHRACLKADLALTDEIFSRLESKVSLVSGLTSDRVIALATEKQNLDRQYSATVVDMEGFGYLEKLQSQGTAVSILRAVSDGCDRDIPNLASAIDNNGNLNSLKLAIAFLQQPIPAFNLITGSLKGLKTLEQLTAELFTN